MRLKALIPEEDDKKKKKQVSDSKLAIELDEREKQVRELKDKLGYLRKEKIQIQQELATLKRENNDNVIRILFNSSGLVNIVFFSKIGKLKV